MVFRKCVDENEGRNGFEGDGEKRRRMKIISKKKPKVHFAVMGSMIKRSKVYINES